MSHIDMLPHWYLRYVLAFIAVAFVLLLGTALLAKATIGTGTDTLDATKAQLEMHKRIEAAVLARATRLGVGKDLVTYCQINLQLKTQGHPIDGQIPYGVDYTRLKSAAELAHVIEVREAYERNYLLLCLTRAARELK